MPSQYETYLRRYLNDNGSVWTSDQIERWALRAENELCRVTPSVIARAVLPIVTGTALYSIPNNTSQYKSLGISQITYRGKVLVPLNQQQQRDYFPDYVISNYVAATVGSFDPASFDNNSFHVSIASSGTTVGGTTSEPQFWAYSGYDENTIQLFPTPGETLSSVDTAAKWNTSIPVLCIAEYRTFQITDQQDKPLYRMVRALVKDYVLAQAFAAEGKGQQMSESKYLFDRFQAKLKIYEQFAKGVYVSHKNEFAAQSIEYGRFPRQPNFGNDIGRRIY